MDEVSVGKLYNHLSRGETRLVVAAVGEEPWLRAKAFSAVENLVQVEGLAQFNYSVLYSDRVDATFLINELRAPPFMGTRRVVVLKRVQKAKKDVKDILSVYQRSPTKTTLLVVLGDDWDFDARCVTRVPCEKFNKRQVKSWVRKVLINNGLAHDKEIVQTVSSMLDGSIAVMERQMEVLRKFLSGRTLTPELAAQVLGEQRATYQDLIQAFRAQEELEFIRNLVSIRDRGVDPRQVFSVLSKEVVIVLRGLALDSEGVGLYDIAEDLEVPVYFLKNLFLNKSKWRNVDPSHVVDAIAVTNERLFSSPDSLAPIIEFYLMVTRHRNSTLI